MVPPGEGNEARGDGRRGVGVSHSTAEAGALSPRDPVEGRGHRQVAPVEGKTANTPRLGPVSTSRQRIAELARQALGMAVAIAWLPGPAGTRRRVAKPSVEEPDAAEPARPDLWGARVSNDPGLPDRMRSVAADLNAFPGFDENLRDALVRETELFVESQIREDRSVVDLLTADYTFVNERLARHYDIPGVYGSRFRRVTLPDDARRGLLGHGSILTVTSHATRTSPVVRGKWVLENILGTPPPLPPPNVPPLPERAESSVVMSMRERMEEHRANPVCASCHARMDPLGFALENFDAVGKWRNTEAGTVIDTAGQLPDGTTFDGLPELRGVLLERQDEFVATVTEKLLTYALGRGVEYSDRTSIRAIVREAETADYRWSALVLGVTKSLPFQMRRSEP